MTEHSLFFRTNPLESDINSKTNSFDFTSDRYAKRIQNTQNESITTHAGPPGRMCPKDSKRINSNRRRSARSIDSTRFNAKHSESTSVRHVKRIWMDSNVFEYEWNHPKVRWFVSYWNMDSYWASNFHSRLVITQKLVYVETFVSNINLDDRAYTNIDVIVADRFGCEKG